MSINLKNIINPNFDKTVPISYGLPIALLLIGFVGDIITTFVAIEILGFIEVNALMFNKYGFSIWVLSISLLFLFIYLVYDWLYQKEPLYAWIVVFIPIIIEWWYGLIHNMILIWSVLL